MKKLIIAVNHSYPDSTGGCEKVVSQISEGLSSLYDYECVILSNSAKKYSTNNGIKTYPCKMVEREFIDQINAIKADHIFVYSDSFYQWPFMVQQANRIDCSKSVALVGMNAMLSNRFLFEQFKKNSDYFSIITHSDNYQDYTKCSENSIPVSVIPNAVDLNEFDIQNSHFREKYNISEKLIILCVSNFFVGKGQEFLLPILSSLEKKVEDFIVVFISSTSQWPMLETRRKTISAKIGKANFKSLFLNDIPRSDVVSAFLESDLFVFPSQKEVSPLVILESMASSTPWVGLSVGNLGQLSGGIVIDWNKKDGNDFLSYNNELCALFCDRINLLLSNDELREKLSKSGREQIEKEYSLDPVLQKYDRFFSDSIDRFRNKVS